MASLGGMAGLASGIDTNNIVDQLMALERRKTTKITGKQAAVKGEQTTLRNIAAKLAALKTAADALKNGGDAFKQTQTVESSDATRVTVSKLSGAGIGGHSIQVDRLAASAQRGFSVSAAALAAGGTITVNGTAFDVAADSTPASIADAINARADSPVFAAVIKSGTDQRIVLSARSSGESSRFTVTSDVLAEDAAYASAANSLDALYRLDGAAVATQSETNVIEDAVPGLRLTLKAITSSPVSVTVGAPEIDRSGVKTKIKALVDAYNAVVDTTRAAIAEKPVANAATVSDLGKGRLFGDTGMQALLSKFRNDLRDPLGGLSGVDDIGDLGIGVPKSSGGEATADAKAGRFTIDDEKLTKALADDWTKVSKFMDAFAAKVDSMVDAQTGKKTSAIDERLAGDDRTTKLLTDQLTQLNLRLDEREKRMKAQFAAMEKALSNSQSQQSWLTGQINSLNR
jgi:flagellar hook-associated protein 2